MAHQTRFRSPQKGYSRVAEKQTLLAIEHELDRELAGGLAPDEEQQLARLPTDSIARMMLEPTAAQTETTAAESPSFRTRTHRTRSLTNSTTPSTPPTASPKKLQRSAQPATTPTTSPTNF